MEPIENSMIETGPDWYDEEEPEPELTREEAQAQAAEDAADAAREG